MLEQTILSGEIVMKKISKIKCKICGREFEKITWSHLETHDMTINEYIEQFPDASLISEDYRKKLRENQPDRSGEKNGMYGKLQTEEAKQKMSDNHGDVSGEKNPMYGRTGEKNPMYGRTGEKNPMYGKGYLVAGEKHPLYGRKRPEHSKKMKGEKHPNWHDGISYEPYCIKFDNDLKERVRNFFDRKCYVCGKNEVDNGRRLDVHHVNYNKMVCCNDVKPLFVPLCRSCHTKTQKDREGWEEFFTVSLEYLTNGQCFIPKKCATEKK